MNLPRLRMGLDIRPTSDPQRPGLLMRDNYRYSDAWIVIPPVLSEVLRFFDGAHTEQDLQAELGRLTGQTDPSVAGHLIEVLDRSGFLENATFSQLRESRHRAFAESPVRSALHAGSGYPNEADALRVFVQGFLEGPSPVVQPGVLGIAAPHVSPGGGRQSYGAAYRALAPDLRDRTFIILGTSHYGQANRFGLTRKPFETPLGTTRTDPVLLNELAEQKAVIMEDYCQVIEHSIEFQVLFLQYLYGPEVRVLPLLCGSFWPSIESGGRPEDDDAVRRLFGTLGAIAARDADRLFWVMGVDMAHIGTRYGDSVAALAERDQMLRVRERDSDRIASLNAGDPEAFWDKVSENRDDLRWCGSSPLYTFMRVVPDARGTLQSYEQWNIDAESVVSFAGISFAKA